MSPATRVVRTVDVEVDPAEAFEAFTTEIGLWYASGPYSWNDPTRAIGIRFEPGVGGRLLEMWREGDGFEMGRIRVWEPPSRLVFEFHSAALPPIPTEVEVRFEAIASGTRVTLEHRGLERLPVDAAERVERHSWIQFMAWFRDYVNGRRDRSDTG